MPPLLIWRENSLRVSSFQTCRIRGEQKDPSAIRGSAFSAQLDQLPKPDFLRAWCAVAYTFPGPHPDGYTDAESGWPRALRRFAAEAWRRADAGDITDEELHPCDAQWAGLYDRMHTHEDDETARRFQIAADFGEHADG
jgi:hypothetical protein